MADSGPWKLRLENKFGADEAVIKVSQEFVVVVVVVGVVGVSRSR